MAYYLGIDGGGTRTRCAVADGDTLRGQASASGCNIVRVGSAQSAEAIRTAILKACQAACIEASQIVCTCIGTAGTSSADVTNNIRRFINHVVPGPVIVVGDNEIAMEAAFGGAPGVIVSSGTGSIAYGRNAEGKTARAGGYGFAVSDEGSGHWIGRSAVSATLRAIDAGQQTLLLQYIQEAWQAPDCAQIVKKANTAPDFAALFPLVVRAADAGDLIASELLRQAGRELAALSTSVIRRLWPEGAQVEVAILGGVFANAALVGNEFNSTLRSQFPNVKIQPLVSEPLLGALSIARKEWETSYVSSPESVPHRRVLAK